MPTKRSLLLNPYALVAYLLSGGLFLAGWLWFSQVSDRVLASLQQPTGQPFFSDREPDKPVAFDPWQRRLTVHDIQLEEKGIQLSAKQLSIVLNYRHWWGPWFGETVESLTAIELDDANILIDPERMAFTLPGWFQALSVNNGSLSVIGIEQSLPFEHLTLMKEGESRIHLVVASHGDNIDAQHWRFSGSCETSQGEVVGELNLVRLPLTALHEVISHVRPSREKAGLFAEGRVSGVVNAKLSLSWDKQRGLMLKGDAEGQSGQLLLPGASATWQQWQLNNVQFNVNDILPSSAGLTISGLDLKLAEKRIKDRRFSATRLNRLLPFPIASLSINDSRLELEGSAYPWLFEHLNGRIVSGHESKERFWQYQATASLANVGGFLLNGKLSDSGNDYTLKLTDAHLAGPLKSYSDFAGYNRQGTRFNLNYDHQKQAGEVVISDWQVGKGSNDASLALVKALITDASGDAVIRFSIRPGQSVAHLPAQIYQAVERCVNSIAHAPFEYLSGKTGRALEPVLHHEAGKAALTKSSLKNLESLQKVLASRPELNVLIDVGVSESRDWPELSRHELEQALQELYSATRSVEISGASNIPAKARTQLLEQMYLVTRHQKMPDVGEQTPEQRVQKAEAWLLKNWPKTPDQLALLQKARCDFLKNEAGRIGIDARRLELKLSSMPDQVQSEAESVITLRQGAVRE